MKFKVGDILRCVDCGWDYLTEGKEYTVKLNKYNELSIIDDDRDFLNLSIYGKYFELVEEKECEVDTKVPKRMDISEIVLEIKSLEDLGKELDMLNENLIGEMALDIVRKAQMELSSLLFKLNNIEVNIPE